MTTFIHSLLEKSAQQYPDKPALRFKDEVLSFQSTHALTLDVARALQHNGLNRSDRVAVFLPKRFETVASIFGTSKAGGVFVPVNPLLKAPQVSYILRDCNVRVLITHAARLKMLEDELQHCSDLHTIICIDDYPATQLGHCQVKMWQDWLSETLTTTEHPGPVTDADMAAILYTSGSTGNPKGVVLSHRNMVVGAESVSEYLKNDGNDVLLAVLPFSFDYGLSQVTTSFHVGATCVLLDYLLPNDIAKAITKYKVTGLAAVPPLWAQLVKLNWAENAGASLRYFTNSGGAMPEATLKQLRSIFSNASPYLMYGLTEAFRSTYLPPAQVDTRPTSMGKAIPNAEITVVREDGSECAPHEPGELVHSGPLVGLGYWNAPEKTAERFKPEPSPIREITIERLAVWSGDTVYRDEEGYLFFVGRKDDMIKTSGYRVSPTEVEETIYTSGYIVEAAALGIPHPDLGQAIVIAATPNLNGSASNGNHEELEKEIIRYCQKLLPAFMVPKKVVLKDSLPHNANGKIDRKTLSAELQNLFDV
ncbi:acyl-CoA ligase [Oleiphilus messinensis]|uniref:Acyl-CoA ligase n=1 Tax=Oleiphilus messinensis TaxID=141451 RepID=A0A1Y0I6T3_9GAMM|nr:acyl-CoA ligase (AMP-forming), exosortase A system-associated [Oleiphilus messinensis]ARU56208.1 acyl-CoA ligase [Oleiphilus messinensis]